MEPQEHQQLLTVREQREHSFDRALIVMATGQYNPYIHELLASRRQHFPSHVYLFTDQHHDEPNLTSIYIRDHGWPMIPLLRFEAITGCAELYREPYLFMIDAETRFERQVTASSPLVAVLHRNIMRFRDAYNYEDRAESTAYVAPGEGEKHFACGFVGGQRDEFLRMAEKIAHNIRADIDRGIRARWGDESHLNRYLIDNRPTLVLPPSYMCPEGNPYFTPYITHLNKTFKVINKPDTDAYLAVAPKDYQDVWGMSQGVLPRKQ